MEFGQVRKPIRQLRKSLKGLCSDSSAQDVHELRIRVRRVAAIAAALIPEKNKQKRDLLKALKKILKAAGEVRDMDVLIVKARILARRCQNSSVTTLLDHIKTLRMENARGLLKTVGSQCKDTRRILSRFSSQVEHRLRARHPDATDALNKPLPTDAATMLAGELSHWPVLNAENLHAFRIKVTRLRDVLRLEAGADPQFVIALERVRERIGDWHDWQQLKDVAIKVLNAAENSTALEEIEAIERNKFREALAIAHKARRRYLGGSGFTVVEP